MNGIKKFIYDFKRFIPLLLNLTSRDIKIKYRRSVLGIAWSVLNPLLTMIVLTQVFGLLLKIRVDNFPVYYIVGYAMWNFFSESTNLAMHSILMSAPLLKKVYVPKYMFPLEKCLFSLVNFLYSLIAVIIVMIFQKFLPPPTAFLIFIPVIYCFVFCVGMSLILSSLAVFFRDVLHLYGVLLTVWLYLTPIIYPVSLIEGSALVYTVVRCNPLYYYVTYFREILMYGNIPGLVFNLECIAFSLGFLIIGALVFKKTQSKFVLHI